MDSLANLNTNFLAGWKMNKWEWINKQFNCLFQFGNRKEMEVKERTLKAYQAGVRRFSLDLEVWTT